MSEINKHETLAEKDASLGVGHIWTEVRCRAYRTYNPRHCTCEVAAVVEAISLTADRWWHEYTADR